MVKKMLLSRAEFARRAGVSQAAVTKACKTILAEAVDGKRIDSAHPAAAEYLAGPQEPDAPEGLDELHDAAVDFFREYGSVSVNALRGKFQIGYNRAKRIAEAIKALGVDPLKPKKTHVRGTAAAKEKRKAAAAPLATATVEIIETHQKDMAEIEVPEDIREMLDFTLGQILARYGTDAAFVDWLKATKAIEDIHEKRLKNSEKSGELISRQVVKEGLLSPLDGAFTRMLTDGARTIAVRAHGLASAGSSVQDVTDMVEKQLSTFIKPTKSKLRRVLRNA